MRSLSSSMPHALALALVGATMHVTPAAAAPPPPTDAHPRMLLDAETRAAWKKQAGDEHGPIHGAIALCDEARTSAEYTHSGYQGAEWAAALQACLVAWAATGGADHEATALRFFNALLDDLEVVGDQRGGDASAHRDSGYAIRNLAPYTALAYDWLYDAPGMTAELRAHARDRLLAWIDWYGEHGYNAHITASNYHAGYLIAATAIAIAVAGDAGPAGDALWQHVADEMWGKEMAAAFAPGTPLEGGDWGEGWQYAPLAVAEYSLAARLARKAGIEVTGAAPWLDALLRRHVYALSPGDGVFVGGDTGNETPNIKPNVLTLDAIALGDASPDDRRWARGELSRLRLSDHEDFLYDALAGIGDTPQLPPRASWPTWYFAAGTGTIYARTRWDEHAVWTVMRCARSYEIDHHRADAGNFVMSRGVDDLLVDPSPYGSMSTLSGNAPTVTSVHFPPEYIPGQGWWGVATAWTWMKQTASGVIAARCDYADQYRIQERATDVPMAQRDLVLVPSRDGTDASMIVIDRASTTAAARAMYLQFRSLPPLALAGAIAQGVLGASKLVIAGVTRSGGEPSLAKSTDKDCDHAPRGDCRGARFPVEDYRVEIPGPEPRAVHVVSVIGRDAAPPTATEIHGSDWAGVQLAGPRDAVVVWPTTAHAPATLAYTAPRAKAVTHVILGGPGSGGGATIAATAAGATCAVTVTSGGAIDASPAVVTLDDTCAIVPDAASASGSPAAGTKPSSVRAAARASRSGCCDAGSAPWSDGASPLALTGFVWLAWAATRRRAR